MHALAGELGLGDGYPLWEVVRGGSPIGLTLRGLIAIAFLADNDPVSK